MNKSIQFALGKIAILVIGIPLSTAASADQQVSVSCTVSEITLTCKNLDDQSFQHFTATLDQSIIGSGNDPAATIFFESDDVSNYKSSGECSVYLHPFRGEIEGNMIEGDIKCGKYAATLLMSMDPTQLGGSDAGVGSFN
jgi:hypothetical protein